MEPAQFYTGIVAELYAPLRSSAPDPAPYAAFIDAVGQPALELGCGDGDPIIELRRRGYDVDGVDSSAEMLDRCRAAAAADGLDVVLHHQRMQELSLARRYRSVYLAGATFNLLTTDDDAAAALAAIRAHLEPDGAALIPLFIPARTPAESLGQPTEATDAAGAVLRVTTVSEHRDEELRVQEAVLRYERVLGDSHEVEDRTWTLHWHSQEGFRSLAEAAGLRTVAILDDAGNAASSDDLTFAFWLQPDR